MSNGDVKDGSGPKSSFNPHSEALQGSGWSRGAASMGPGARVPRAQISAQPLRSLETPASSLTDLCLDFLIREMGVVITDYLRESRE